jgi:hypothetical protein
MKMIILSKKANAFLSAALAIIIFFSVVLLLQRPFISHADPLPIKTHVFKFYLDPSLVPDMQFAKTNLPKYVQDMNYVLAKNTNRQLVFNPDTDIILTSTKPQSDTANLLPTIGYEIWAHASASAIPTYPYSYGGNMSIDQSGAAVLANLHWTKIFNPDALAAGSEDMHDYWIQIDHMLHEIAHVYGAGNGEYYSLTTVSDTTNTAPLLNIALNTNPTDPFWSDKQDFFSDPLLWIAYNNSFLGNPISRAALLNATKYSTLTATIMNGDYRNATNLPPTVNLQDIRLTIVDAQTQQPLPNAVIKVWSVLGIPGNESHLLVDTVTDTNGGISFSWGGAPDPHNNYDFLRLAKVYKTNYTPVAKYISIYDTDIQKMVGGSATYSATIALTSSGAPTPTPSPSRTPSRTPTATPIPTTTSIPTTTPAIGDTTPPTISITSPANGSSVAKNTTITFTASATDNTAVSKVQFYINGVLQCTDTLTPYTCAWKVPAKQKVSYTIQAKAYDTTNNTSSASVIVTSK